MFKIIVENLYKMHYGHVFDGYFFCKNSSCDHFYQIILNSNHGFRVKYFKFLLSQLATPPVAIFSTDQISYGYIVESHLVIISVCQMIFKSDIDLVSDEKNSYSFLHRYIRGTGRPFWWPC